MRYRLRMTKCRCVMRGDRFFRLSRLFLFGTGCDRRCFVPLRLEHFAAFSRHRAQVRLAAIRFQFGCDSVAAENPSNASCTNPPIACHTLPHAHQAGGSRHGAGRFTRHRSSARRLRDRSSPIDPWQGAWPVNGNFLETGWRDYRCNGRHLATPTCASASKSRCTSRFDKPVRAAQCGPSSEPAVPS